MSEQELDFVDGLATFVDERGFIHMVVDPESNLGKANGGKSKNDAVATSHGFQAIRAGKRVVRVNLNAIR